VNHWSPQSRLVLVGALTAASVIACNVIYSGGGPRYDGRSLGTWVEIHGGGLGRLASDQEREEAAAAIREIGTNALPCLLSWVSETPKPWRKRIEPAVNALPGWLSRRRFIQRLLLENDERAQNSIRAFKVLGPLAAPAIPELARLARLTNHGDLHTHAVLALSAIGSPAVPVLTNLLADPNASDWWAMEWGFRSLGTNAGPAAGILIEQLQHTNAAVAISRAHLLGEIRIAPDRAVPALIEAMNDPRPGVERAAIEALGRYGPDAKTALPVLAKAAADPSRGLNVPATLSMKMISSASAR
jgi:hypothetical protein